MEIVKKTFVKYGNCQYEFVKRGICQVEKYTFQIPHNVFFIFIFLTISELNKFQH